jgi:hypothetical protein
VYFAHRLLHFGGHELIDLSYLGKNAERLVAHASAKTLRFLVGCRDESWPGRGREDAATPRGTQQPSRLLVDPASSLTGLV